MSQATKLGAVEKAEIVKRYLVGEIGQNEAARIAGVVPAPFVLWVNKYKNDGVLGLAPQGKNNIYKHRAEASSGMVKLLLNTRLAKQVHTYPYSCIS